MYGSNSQAAPEYLGRDKQLVPLVLLRSSDVADRRLIELTEPPARAIFADVNLGAGLVQAEWQFYLVARAEVRGEKSGHENRCALAQHTLGGALLLPDANNAAAMDGFDACGLWRGGSLHQAEGSTKALSVKFRGYWATTVFCGSYILRASPFDTLSVDQRAERWGCC